jgi:hypothetical protein
VARVARWEEVSSVVGVVPVGYGPRVVYQVKHHRGRSIRFTELPGRETLGPLLRELHAEAVRA